MISRQDAYKALRGVLGDMPGIAVIHSSLAELVPAAGFDRWDILYALERLVGEGWTLALPAFTFSFCGGKPYHYRESRSEVGVLADWLLEHGSAVRRTPHPIYSFVVAGPRSDEVMGCASTTTFGDDSPFGLFEKLDAHQVMLGCGWKYATQLHRPEEKAQVPYRYLKEFQGKADFGDGERSCSAAMFVRDLAGNPQNDFLPAITRLRDDGLIVSKPLWRGMLEAVRTSDLMRVCVAYLAENPYAFVANGPAVAWRMAKAKQAAAQPALKVAILGSANVHFLRLAVETQFAALIQERRVETQEVPYGQLRQALLDPSSQLRQGKPEISIFCDRLEDLLGKPILDDADETIATDLVTDYAALIAAYHEANGGWSIVHRFAALNRPIESRGGAIAAMVDQMNALLAQRLSDLKQLLWLDVAAEAAAGAGAPVVDLRLWHIGRIPYSQSFSDSLALRWAGLSLAILGLTARAVILDLDNTLWGGVLGEDGLTGVKLGGDFPGNAYSQFQRAVASLTGRGIALTVVSKNDQDLALKAMTELPGMHIRPAHLVAYRINWQPKWSNIQAIAEELNLGLESILFVDDNPVEREAVRRNLPGVKVLDLPADPALYAQALLASPWLEMAEITAEDRKRVKSYQARHEIEQQRRSAASLEDFYAALEMKLHLQPLDDRNAPRAAQLCGKTNQFNSTTRRYGQRELHEIVEQNGDVVVIGLEDRHNDFENIGLIIIKPDDAKPGQGVVDLYLMSCRVLGRGIETAVLKWARKHAARRGWTVLNGLIIETERNTPARGVFRDAGFDHQGDGHWSVSTQVPSSTPAWLTVIDRVMKHETKGYSQ